MRERKLGGGRTALVTGASFGIGEALAECFARDGYDLILAARGEPALNGAASRLSAAFGVKAVAIAVDLGEPGAGKKLAELVRARGFSVDVLVNNAGFGCAGAFAESDIDTQLGMIDLNNRALVELTHIYWPGMIERKRGGILNVASTAAFVPGPLMAVYYASKAFVLSFTEALWEEARGTGLHVSCLCPGPTVSKFRERAGSLTTRLAKKATAMKSVTVAEAGYAGFRKDQRVVIPGSGNKRNAWLAPFVPRTTLLRVMRDMLSPG